MPRLRHRLPRPALGCLSLLALSAAAGADTPLGWVSGDLVHAYTQDARSVEVTAERIAVNDTIDFLDIRDELLAGNRRLEDNSGDLKGWQGTIRVGVLEMLELFYRRQEHDLVLKLGPVNSLGILDVDQELRTTLNEGGLKWTFYQADRASRNQEITAASLELAWLKNESDDFSLAFDRITFNAGGTSASITFNDTQRAGIDNLEDEGWRARLVYTTQLADSFVGSVWAGYSDHSASSGTSSTVPIPNLRDALTQRFDVEERHLMLGMGFNWQLTPRIPLQLSYEYVNIHSQDITAFRAGTSSFALPGFLSSSTLSTDDANHTLSGSISWWATPWLNLGLTGKLFSNQFLGLIPHYNNPLSASFSDTPYGYLGLRLGLSLGK